MGKGEKRVRVKGGKKGERIKGGKMVRVQEIQRDFISHVPQL
jgi:hypothetical protein